MASADMESVELEMEMPPLDVKIRPSILSNASLAISGESNTAIIMKQNLMKSTVSSKADQYHVPSLVTVAFG